MTIPRVQHFDESPRAPTPAANDNSTKVATTEYVDRAAAGSGDILVDDVTGAVLVDDMAGQVLYEG